MTIHQIHPHHPPRSPLRWTTHAACQDADPDLFFPISWDDNAGERARRVCHGCPVREACLDWAVRTGEPDGVWGGATPAERRLMRRQATA